MFLTDIFLYPLYIVSSYKVIYKCLNLRILNVQLRRILNVQLRRLLNIPQSDIKLYQSYPNRPS